MSSVKINTLPEGWKVEELEKLIDLIQNGISSKQNDEMIGYPVSRIETIQNSTFDKNRIKYVDADNDAFNKYKYDIGDISFSHINSYEIIGKVAIYRGDIDNLLHGVNLLRLKFNDKIYSEYGYYFFKSSLARKEYEQHIKRAINQASINQKNLKSILVPFPPLEEQKRIVAKIDNLFDKIDKAISLTEESLVQAKNLLPSVLKEVFEKGKADGWEEKKLVDLKESNIIGLVRNAKQQSIDFSFEYVKMNNVTNDNRFTFNNITCVEANEKEVQKFKLVKGDFLFNTRNSFELVGKSCIYDSDKENVLYNNNLMRIRFKNGINPYFILYQFSSPFLISQLRNIKSGTTNVCAIYYHSLKDILLLVSSSDTQDKLVTYFNNVSKQAQQAQSKLEEQLTYLKQLKSSILSKAFKGEL